MGGARHGEGGEAMHLGSRGRKQPLFRGVKPVWGDNYRRGFIGFTHHDTSLICEGISWFTDLDGVDKMPWSHCLIVTGPDECIEANPEGVVRSGLRDRLADPHCRISFRKPEDMTDGMANEIVAVGEKQLGCKYDYPLLAAHAVTAIGFKKWFLGRVINRVFGNRPEEMVTALLNHDRKWICSELCAHALDEQPQYRDRGVLAQATHAINPNELMWSFEIWSEWDAGGRS